MGQIITFYSFKGGVGRSMALANVAVLMAQWGYKVLMIDWDLEAPGLEHFFKNFINMEKIKEKPGIIDILLDRENGEINKTPNWLKWVTEVKIPNIKKKLHLLTAGQENDDYFTRVRDLNVDKFYLEQEGGQFIETIRNDWLKTYDFVLIDSRTGITDIGGICTIQLPDILLLLFAPTDQALNGIIDVAKKAYLARQRLPVDRMGLISVPIPSRFDTTQEFEISQAWLDIFARKLADIYADWLPRTIKPRDILELTKLPYVPYFSFGEKLPVLEKGTNDPSGLGYAYKTLAALLASKLETVEEVIDERVLKIKTPEGDYKPKYESMEGLKLMPTGYHRRRMWDTDAGEVLLHTINKGNCILMLGPDASLEEVDGVLQPLTQILARQLAEKISPQVDSHGINPSDLAQVAYYFWREKGRIGLEVKVHSFYKKRINLTSEFHKNLAALPFYLTIIFNPDRMFYNALVASGKRPVIKGYNFQSQPNPIANVRSASPNEPMLFSLYGTLEDPNSLVLTENDLLDFLLSIISKNPPPPQDLLNELQDDQKNFLFLGFDFNSWYMKILLRVLLGTRKKMMRSFAVEQLTPQNRNDLQTPFFIEDNFGIYIYDMESDHFAKELRYRYEEISPARSLAPLAVQTDAPKVFISHASEDKDFASFLYKKLEKAGFKPWLDKESLRGGDEWDSMIKKTIEEIDYFIVLQSSALLRKHIGYVNREINLAMDRQDMFRRGIRFIIPVRIEDSPLLVELEHLHTIDLSHRENVEELIKTIRRDQMKRKGD